MKRILVLSLLVLVAGCNTWERTTFQALSASKATIDNAQAQYEAKAIAQNQCSYAVINDAKASQVIAVNGFLAYEQVKTAKGDIATAEATVNTELASLVPLVAQVTALLSNPAAPCTGGAK
jgi:FKBP-type peptidyl-prolyl cis-trans isomerase